jgi:hypothetical protein
MKNSIILREEEKKRKKPLKTILVTISQIHLLDKIKLIIQVVVRILWLVVITFTFVVIDVVIEHPYNVICMCTVPLNGTNELSDYTIHRL